MSLTIAIPTYNRNATLLNNLRLLLPQMTSDCRLLVLDNASPTPVMQTIQGVLDQYSHVNASVVRNSANIGGAANILRCFELCETEWLWVLGDDDSLKEDAIATINCHLSMYPNCIFVNFSRHLPDYPRPRTFLTKGVDEFIRKFDYLSELVFISSSIWRAELVRSNLRFGYHYSYSMYPNLALLLVSLGENGICCFSNECLVEFEPAPVEQRWSLLLPYLGFPTLLELPLSRQMRKTLASKFPLSLEYLVYHLIRMALRDDDYDKSLYIFEQVAYRLLYFDRSLTRMTKLAAYRTLVKNPQIGNRIVVYFAWVIRGMRIEKSEIPSETERL